MTTGRSPGPSLRPGCRRSSSRRPPAGSGPRPSMRCGPRGLGVRVRAGGHRLRARAARPAGHRAPARHPLGHLTSSVSASLSSRSGGASRRGSLPVQLGRHSAGPERIIHEPGCAIPGPIPCLGPGGVRTSAGDEGIEVEYFAGKDWTGPAVLREVFTQSRLIWSGPPHPALTAGESRPGPRPCLRLTTAEPGTSGSRASARPRSSSTVRS